MDYTGKIISKNPPQPTQASASGVWTLDEAAAAVKNNSWPIPGVPNPISKSLRFNSADSAYLNRTPSSAGNRRTWTWSCWVKRSRLGTFEFPFSAGPSTVRSTIGFRDSNTFYVRQVNSSDAETTNLATTQVFRDVSAWYHIVVAYDNTQSTASNRVKIYVNGTQATAFDTAIYPNQNETDVAFNSNLVHEIGRYAASPGDGTLAGYLTEMYFIDGQALTPSSFGQTNANTGVWEPKPYTGTYGGNGFYLNFKDSATTTALGYDYSGNGNNFTANNFSVTAGAGNDSLVDVPTQWIGYNTSGDVGGVFRGNYCTWNPLDTLAAAVANYTNGNLNTAYTSANYTGRATMAVTTGKWYWEITVTTTGNPIGIATAAAATNQYPGQNASSWGYYENGNKYTNGSASAYGNSYTTGDVIGVAFDADGGNLYFYKNGTVQNSGTAAFTSLTSGPYFPAIGNGVYVANFGQRPFAYTPPAGYLSLCTTNLPTPTIGATSTTQAGKYFNTIIWTGTDTAASRSFTGVGFQPDFVWAKIRSNTGFEHLLYDSVRGAGNDKELSSNSTGAEGYLNTDTQGYLSSFNSDGFSSTAGTIQNEWFNRTGYTYVAWNWNAGGSSVTNTAGTITSTVRANTTAGFSVVTYTGNGSTSATVGHGLGTTPSMVIVKKRSAAANWFVKHSSVPGTQQLLLNDTLAATNAGSFTNGGVGNLASTTFGFLIGTSDVNNCNENTATFVAYCFSEVAGYSKFGSYTGNGSTDGPFVFTGFRPAWVWVKPSSTTGDWLLYDNKRNSYNVVNNILYPNTSGAEATSGGGATLDFVSNGFKLRGAGTGFNDNGTTFVYAAFAESPFKYSLAR